MNFKRKGLGIISLCVSAIIMASSTPAHALSPEYLRNGECYLLIGEGDNSLRGCYRLNNPELTTPAYYNPAKQVLLASDIKDTLGFNVDLNRIIYTFTQKTDSNWSLDTAPLYRQVLDGGVTGDQADYGYHSYIHYDYRDWGYNTAVYRTGPVGRNIHKDGGGTWSGFKSAGPGTVTSKPSGYTQPSMSGAASLGEYSGKTWYKIPNGSWYSNWKTASADAMGDYKNGRYSYNGFNKFYYVFGDKVNAKYHNYFLYTWTPDNPQLDKPNYNGYVGSQVAQTKEEKVNRDILAGCLDGCGGASGSGSSEAATMHSDIAFQPPLQGGTKRVYFYTRTINGTNYDLKLNNSAYNPGSTNPLIGKPASTDTYWLCISLKEATADYVYCLGTAVIKEWYKQATGKDLNNMKIDAVTASNQWDQEGGIVYAYDSANRKIYKFERNEKSGTPVTAQTFLALDVANILNSVGANTSAAIDDVKADGFGSMYFALSHPAINDSIYYPPNYFKPNDCIAIKQNAHDTSKKETSFYMLYKKEFGKVVFERNYLTGDVFEIGRKNFAVKYYNVSGKIKDAGWDQIKNLTRFDNLNNILASWSATIAGKSYVSSWPASYWNRGIANFSSTTYQELSYTNPGKSMLAVINVPTPPQVLSLGDKKSYLDIIGPYEGIIPMPDKVNRNTNQGDGLKKNLSYLNLDTLYFYMAENYPLDDGAQDPTAQQDYDGDGRRGGFITSIKDPAPLADGHSDGVDYIWKTWMVMDLYGNSVCKLAQQSTTSNPYNYFYSPVYGKFIMTCRVKYHWYDYDALPFGSTIDNLSSVLHKNEWAIPVAKGAISMQAATNRLSEIKNMSTFSFMKSPTDSDGNPITVDYSPITADGSYLAMEPIVAGSGKDSLPTQNFQVAKISRCDEIPGWDESNYIGNDNYWSSVPTGGFGIEAGQSYYWRIDVASQSNMFKDISKINGTNANDTNNYNYIAHQMITPGTPFYVNAKSNFKFQNNVGDVRWTDDKILVSAKLVYKVPNGDTYKEITLPLTQGKSATDFEEEKTIKPETTLWAKNIPIYSKTMGDLPPTDPFEATIEITMRRQYNYDMWAYYNGQPSFPVSNLPGWLKITGTAKVVIMDSDAPTIAWSETTPNNLFGITGTALAANVGPAGKTNPANISFTVTDNNPWEAVQNREGLAIAQHIINHSKNNGAANTIAYCNTNDTLKKTLASVASSVNANSSGVKSQIQSAKQNHQKSSHLNLVPVFSRAARDVRISFETAKRETSGANLGSVTVDKANALYGTTNGCIFDSDDKAKNYYAYHWHSGSESKQYLSILNQSYSRTVGGTVVYDSTIKYQMATANIRLGQGANNVVPDGYANNTPGYGDWSGNRLTKIRPYKFFISLIDSSGNYSGEQELNMVLNVKDDIPPVGYGSMMDQKDKITTTFPYKTDKAAGKNGDEKYTPVYSLTGENYFAMGLNPKLVREANWAAANTATGYMNGYNTDTYQAIKSMGDKIAVGVKDSVFIDQVKANLSPRATEDNVECSFGVFVTDNCGNATATMTVNYFNNDGRSSTAQAEKTLKISSGFTDAKAKMGAKTAFNNDNKCASTSASISTVFRGRSDQFPMAIPVTITATDDARDWDYYENCIVDGTGWHWGTIKQGAAAGKTRTFKTSVPVFGSDLNIRTLDKTISDSKE